MLSGVRKDSVQTLTDRLSSLSLEYIFISLSFFPYAMIKDNIIVDFDDDDDTEKRENEKLIYDRPRGGEWKRERHYASFHLQNCLDCLRPMCMCMCILCIHYTSIH